MKRRGILLVAALTAVVLCAVAAMRIFGGEGGRSIDYIIANEPCVKGVVTEVYQASILLSVNEGEEALKSSDLIYVSLNAESSDSVTQLYAGDEIAVYYNGEIAETYPAQINTVYAILLVNGGEERAAAEAQSLSDETGSS